jgi:hypothetical protein
VLGSESSLRVKLNALKEGPSQSLNIKIDRDALALQPGQLSLAAFKILEEKKV